MENYQLTLQSIHLFAVVVVCTVIAARALTLFKGTQGHLPNPAGRKLFVALQHASMTVLVLTGIVLLYLKNFEVQSWFYAKLILFAVLLSSLSKAYRKTDTVFLTQRRAGLFLAAVAMLGIIGLVMIKPNFG